MKKFALAFAAVSAFSVAQANAEVTVADTDGNGAYSMEELLVAFPTLTEAAFKAADANADGAISAEELTAAEAAFAAPAADAAATTEAPAADAAATTEAPAAATVVTDVDADGSFSMEELKAAFPDLTEEAFKAADANADGVVSAEELKAAQDAGNIPA
jgi:Ca2+-binding EF-hand superfamily protein